MRRKPVEQQRMQELYEMYDDIIFKMALHEYQERELEEVGAEPMTDEEIAEMNAFFARTEKKTLDTIDKEFRAKRTKRFVKHTLPRIAMVSVIVISLLAAGFATAVATIPEVRARVLEYIHNLEAKYTELGVISSAISSLDIPKEWKGEYYPVHFPSGYKIDYVNEVGYRVFYSRNDGSFIRFTEYQNTEASRIDSENAAQSPVIIQGQSGALYEKNGTYRLVWFYQDRYFTLVTNTSAEVIIEIADSLRKISR